MGTSQVVPQSMSAWSQIFEFIFSLCPRAAASLLYRRVSCMCAPSDDGCQQQISTRVECSLHVCCLSVVSQRGDEGQILRAPICLLWLHKLAVSQSPGDSDAGRAA